MIKWIPPFVRSVTALPCLATACLAAAAATPRDAPAQAEPTVAGEIEIRLREGAIRGNVCLTNLDPADTLALALNAALSLRTVAGQPPEILEARAEPGDATTVYTLSTRTRSREDPLCVTYDGWEQRYDVAAGLYRDDDVSSLIAFDGHTIRARGAARWLPTPFDRRISLPAERMSFDLQIRCFDCESIYMNGADATPGPVASFRSDTPREPYLVAGHLHAAYTNGSWILSSREFGPAADSLLTMLQPLQDLYADYLGVPFDREIDLLLLTEVREPRRGRLWGFFSDPALTLMGMSADEMLAALGDERERVRISVLRFLAHELAHRYFGWELGLQSPQRDLFGEPFATFLELKALRQLVGVEAYASAIRGLASQLSEISELPPADQAGARAFTYGAYRYAYLPLLLLTLEAAIGAPQMRELLRSILMLDPSSRATANFETIVDHAASIADPVAVTSWQRCLDRDILESVCVPALLP